MRDMCKRRRMDRCDVVVLVGPARQGSNEAMASRDRVGAARVSGRFQWRRGSGMAYSR